MAAFFSPQSPLRITYIIKFNVLERGCKLRYLLIEAIRLATKAISAFGSALNVDCHALNSGMSFRSTSK